MDSKLRVPIGVMVLVAIVVAGALPASAAASPARYVYEKCDSVLPGGGVSGIVYAPHPMLPFSSENTCGQRGGALVLRQGHVSPGGAAYFGIPIERPPGGRLESITITAASCAGAPSHVFLIGWPTPSCLWDVRSFRLDDDFKAFFMELNCIGECPAGPWIAARYFATTVVDPVAPTLARLDGTLLDPGVKRGRQSIGVEAEDIGGGLSNLSLSVNGLPAAQPRTPGCNIAHAENPSVVGTVAAQVTPCPPRASAEWTVETGAYPFRDGANRVEVCASDFATLGDPNTTCSVSRTVFVDNSCIESPVPGGEVLSAQFSRSHDDTVTVPFGKGAELSGRLANDAGDPIPGATLCLKMQTIGVERQASTVGAVTTDAEGRYRHLVAPGPNREIVVGYRHGSSQVARDVRYYARARPSLRVNHAQVVNGARVRFRGQLPEPSNGGRVVILQAGTVGSKRWITFRRATANATGGFRAAYRFTSTTRRTRYRFRAVVPRQAGYPWVEGHSKPVEVLVRG